MSDESGLAYQQAKADYQASRAQAGLTGQDPAAVSPAALLEAASAHLAASRPLAEALAEYEPLLELLSADQSFDREALATLGQEVSTARSAQANLEGNLPGAGHSAVGGDRSLRCPGLRAACSPTRCTWSR